jgi:selenocysteine lyase/cysteine desulfurase
MSVQAARAVQDYLERRTEGAKEPDWDVSARVKEDFAALINARPAEIGYVTSTMAGENLVVAGLGLGRGRGNVVTDALHFEGSLYLYGSLRARGVDVRVVRPREWRIDPRDLDRAIDHDTKLVAVSLVSFLNGFQHDLKAVSDLAHAKGAFVYADIIQAAGAIPIDVAAAGVDFAACASYKWLMGDFGLGFFYVREDRLDRVLPRCSTAGASSRTSSTTCCRSTRPARSRPPGDSAEGRPATSSSARSRGPPRPASRIHSPSSAGSDPRPSRPTRSRSPRVSRRSCRGSATSRSPPRRAGRRSSRSS